MPYLNEIPVPQNWGKTSFTAMQEMQVAIPEGVKEVKDSEALRTSLEQYPAPQ